MVAAIGVSATFMPGCGYCHMRGSFANQTLKTTHSDVACKSCHGGTTVQSRVAFGTSQVFGMVLHVTKVDPTVAQASSAQCRSCHKATDSGVVAASSGLRIIHKTCAYKRECTDCHSPVAHGTALKWPRTATMDMCFECHGTRAVTGECNKCHEARLPSDRIKTGTFAVTHGPNYRKTHGMGNMRLCAGCHQSSKCEKCHGVGLPHKDDFVRTHGEVSTAARAKCTTCHRKSFCKDCHGYDMPHPTRFLERHAQASEKAGKATCLRCHAENDCVDCHIKHVHPTTLEELRALGKLPAPGDKETTGAAR